MAYAASITATRRWVAGRLHLRIEIAETEAAAGSEWSYGDGAGEYLPEIGTITSYQAKLTAGTGTTIAPRLGKATGWSDDTQNQITQSPTASAQHHDQSLVRYTAAAGARPAIFGKSTVDAAADNSIATIIELVEGHLP